MNKQMALVIVLFVVALGSGVLVGMGVKRHIAQPPQDRSWLADELKLNPEQREKMRAIWSQVLRDGPGPRHWDKRRQLVKERDEAIAALITPEQKPAYDKILERYSQQTSAMNHERDAAFQKAIEQTKAILDPEQRQKYEQILARGPQPGGRPHGEFEGPRMHGPGSRPSSRPAETK